MIPVSFSVGQSILTSFALYTYRVQFRVRSHPGLRSSSLVGQYLVGKAGVGGGCRQAVLVACKWGNWAE